METNLPSKNGEALSHFREYFSVKQDDTSFGSSTERPQWFAVYTMSRHEKHVSAQLSERRVETFLPLYRATREWKKSRRVTVELPLYPGYIFVHIPSEARSRVISVPGVLSLVGSHRHAWPLPEDEIEILRAGLHLRNVQPHPYLIDGERVKIGSGALAGIEGILLRKDDTFKVVITLELIRKSMVVEVEPNELIPYRRDSFTN